MGPRITPGDMAFAFTFVATFCAALFAGAALYITFVEHPARMECGTVLAATQFGPSYRRATVMQASLAAVSFLTAIGAWLSTSRLTWLLGAILIGAVIPVTLIVIFPTNKKLLDPALDRNSDLARQLLDRWGKLHAVRTLLSVAASTIFLLSIVSGSQAGGRPPGDSILGAKEAVLRQNLFTLRSLISQYTLDKQKAPQSLDDLVRAGYLKKIPIDPMTATPDWNPEMSAIDADGGPRIVGVHSSSPRISSDGRPYTMW
jgi:uncharacterized membrane protein